MVSVEGLSILEHVYHCNGKWHGPTAGDEGQIRMQILHTLEPKGDRLAEKK